MTLTHRRTFIVKSAQWLTLAALPLHACTDPESGEGEGTGSTTDATGTSTGGSTGPVAGGTSSGGIGGSGSSGESTAGTTDEGSTTEVADSSSGGSETGAVACEPTATDIEGPFYRPRIPIGGDLDVWGDEGDTLTIRGRVTGDDCRPLADAVVEIWHATPVTPGGVAGRVDDATYDATDDYRYYGQVATAADGSFEFQTLRPGWYLNGAAYRPAHIHVKVWVRGAERLTTQLYFVGDPFNAKDPWFNPDLALDPDGAGLVEIELVV